MPELRLEDHSEEVQAILGRVPKWIIRWGITVLFATVAVVFVGSYFIPYPETISLPVKITALNAPAPIVAQQGSTRIAEWFAKDQQIVEEGELLAVWKSNDNFNHFQLLKEFLSQNLHEPSGNGLDTLQLPSLNPEIRDFVSKSEELSVIQTSTKHIREIDRLNKEIIRKTDYISLLNQQKQVKEREFGMLEKKFQQDSTYYYNGGYGIIKRDYENALMLFLQQKSSFLQYKASLVDIDKSLLDLKNEVQRVQNERADQLISAEKNLNESVITLMTKIKDWETKNLLTSPINGKLDRSSLWSENQFIANGEVIATIIPKNPTEIICRAFANARAIGAIKQGQRVLIKLDGFNSQVFGSIEGVVSSVSNIPLNEEYLVKIELPSQLTTNEGKQIPLIQELTGVAEVITSEIRLLFKLIDNGK